MFGLIPKEEMFFEMFQEMGGTIITGAEKLKLMMEQFQRCPVKKLHRAEVLG